MKFLNTKDMFISEGDDYNVIGFDLEVDELLDQKLDGFIDKMADYFVEIAAKIKASRIDNQQKYFFEFRTDLTDVEDLKQVSSVIGVMLFKSQLKKKRKNQLAFFKLEQLGDIAITQMTLADLLKNKSYIKYVNYSVLTKDENLKFYMIGADEDEGEAETD